MHRQILKLSETDLKICMGHPCYEKQPQHPNGAAVRCVALHVESALNTKSLPSHGS